MTAPIVYVDTETTRLGPRRLPWDLALIRVEPDGTRWEFQTFIDIDLSDADPFSLGIGRFYERHPVGIWHAYGVSEETVDELMDGPPTAGARPSFMTLEQAAGAWCRWTHGCHVIGAVPNFDTEVMGDVVRENRLIANHHYHLSDIENLIAGFLRGRLRYDREMTVDERARVMELADLPWDSDALFAEIGVTTPEGERHTALGDARTVERAHNVLLAGGM